MLPYVSFLFLYWVTFSSRCSDRVFFHLEDKKVVAGRVRQVVIFYKNDCMGICLDGLSIGCLNRFDYNSSTIFKLLSDCLANLYACNSRFEIRKLITGKLFLCVLKINFKTVKASSTCMLRK